ncbi:hypothetical protein [Fluviispira sanaruensis]
MGQHYQMTEEYIKAVKAFTKAIDLNPVCAYC